MRIGFGNYINDDYFSPFMTETNCKDKNGELLLLGDGVVISGCRADIGFIGKDASGKFCLYFAVNYNNYNTTCSWALDKNTCSKIQRIDLMPRITAFQIHMLLGKTFVFNNKEIRNTEKGIVHGDKVVTYQDKLDAAFSPEFLPIWKKYHTDAILDLISNN